MRDMGTDIHGWVETKIKTKWHGVIKIDWLLSRNYLMFGCLFDEKCYFESVASSIAPTNTSDEVSYDNEFQHIGSEQCLTYSEIKEINWDEPSIELFENVYVKDGFDELHLIKQYELTNSDYDRLQKEKSFKKDCLVFKLERITRKDCLTPDWIRLFDFMRVLADEFGDEHVRLVAWFDC